MSADAPPPFHGALGVVAAALRGHRGALDRRQSCRQTLRALWNAKRRADAGERVGGHAPRRGRPSRDTTAADADGPTGLRARLLLPLDPSPISAAAARGQPLVCVRRDRTSAG